MDLNKQNISAQDLAERFNIGVKSIYPLFRNNRLKHIRINPNNPKTWRTSEQWVKEYINSQVKKGSIKEFVESEIKRRQEKKKTIDKTTLIEAYHGRGSKNV
jgi:uncharacterized protein YicC (UPF0701 family)